MHEEFGRCKLCGTCRALGLFDTEFEVCRARLPTGAPRPRLSNQAALDRPSLTCVHANAHAQSRAREHECLQQDVGMAFRIERFCLTRSEACIPVRLCSILKLYSEFYAC